MKQLETDTKQKILPSIMSPKTKPHFTYHKKSEACLKNQPNDELRINFLTRYNKKFWGVSNKENQRNNSQAKNTDCKVLERFKSQNLKKNTPLDLIEINDFDDRMKNELENIDRWVFNNLKKMSLPVNITKNKDDKDSKKVNLDVQMLNFIIQTSHHAIDSPRNGGDKKNVADVTLNKDLQNKIAITSETLNNEHNKAILIDLIGKKLLSHKEYQTKDNSYNVMLAKMIATDLIASFKALNVFKHQNVLRLKEILETISETMAKARESTERPEYSDTAEDYLYYEKKLKKNLRECEEEIKTRKEALKKLFDAIRQKKNNINIEKQRLFDFAKML